MFHSVDVYIRQLQYLTVTDALDCEETSVSRFEPIAVERKLHVVFVVHLSFLIEYLCSMVENRVFDAKMLEQSVANIGNSRICLFRIYNCKYLILIVWYDESTDTTQAKVEVIDYITRLVEKAALCH